MPDAHARGLSQGRHMLRRGALLGGCVTAGLVIGVAGHAWSGQAAWFLALPAAIAIGWLFVADPTQCVPDPGGRERRAHETDQKPAPR